MQPAGLLQLLDTLVPISQVRAGHSHTNRNNEFELGLLVNIDLFYNFLVLEPALYFEWLRLIDRISQKNLGWGGKLCIHRHVY